MNNINNKELVEIKGGTTINGTLLNSIAKLVETIFNLGRSIGSSITRLRENNLCK